MEYCAGVYEIAFRDILRKLDAYGKNLKDSLAARMKVIEEIREMKIAEMLATRVK